MFDNQLPPFETHLFEFSGDIYGRHLTVALLHHIRGQEVFPGLQDLVAAIDRDSAEARRILAAAGPLSALDKRLGFFG
jgi:riboflavin kinase/FMN adenylyltransferase